jgi:hypothetical protein
MYFNKESSENREGKKIILPLSALFEQFSFERGAAHITRVL